MAIPRHRPRRRREDHPSRVHVHETGRHRHSRPLRPPRRRTLRRPTRPPRHLTRIPFLYSAGQNGGFDPAPQKTLQRQRGCSTEISVTTADRSPAGTASRKRRPNSSGMAKVIFMRLPERTRSATSSSTSPPQRRCDRYPPHTGNIRGQCAGRIPPSAAAPPPPSPSHRHQKPGFSLAATTGPALSPAKAVATRTTRATRKANALPPAQGLPAS